jgi:hypothetical protein
MLFYIQRKKQPSIRGSHEGVVTISHWGIKSNFIPIIKVLPQNWFKTAWLLRMDDLMAIYTLVSSNVVHISGAVGLW